VLFLLEIHNATGKKVYLDEACAGADYIVQRLDSETEIPPGLYTGIAGLVFCLEEVYRASGRGEYRAAAKRGLQRLHEGVEEVGAGVAWNTSTDIVSGTAGIGLTFLYAAGPTSERRHLELAAAAGYRLLELGQSDSGGTKWPMSPDYPRLMPNLSHGTAGVCYFLASLYQHTGEPEFLDAALGGAKYLQAVAQTDGDVCLVFHHEPDGRDLYYLSWCHGPVGTARLFYRLAMVTGDDEWLDWVARGARGILRSGIPEVRTPGFWNNVSQCCGDAGVGEFFLSLYRVTGNSEYLDMTWRVRESLLARASDGAEGISWPQAEHRTRPELIAAQTGFMQGAAGVATFLVHLDDQERGRQAAIALPDSPFT
jgi:lantibiotic modifying enzyme